MKKYNEYQLALFVIILVAFIGGASPVAAKVALKEIPPFTFTFLRFVIAFFCFLPFIRKSFSLKKSNWKKLLFIPILSTLNIILFSYGIRLTTATISQMLYAAVPVVTAILSYFILGEKFTGRKITGISTGFMGVLIIILLPQIEKSSVFSGNLLGNLLIFAGVFFFSLYGIFSKDLHSKFSVLEITLGFIISSLVLTFPFALFELQHNPTLLLTISREALIGLFYMGIFSTAIYYGLYQYAVKRGTPLIASLTLYLQPLTTIVWASWLLGEKITSLLVVGGVFTLIGVWLITKNTKQAPMITD